MKYEQQIEKMSRQELESELLLLQKSEQIKSDQIAKTKQEKQISKLIEDLREIRTKINFVNQKLNKLNVIDGPVISTMTIDDIVNLEVDDTKPTEILTRTKQEILYKRYEPINEIEVLCMEKEDKIREKELYNQAKTVLMGALSVNRDEKRKQELQKNIDIITNNIKLIDEFM